MHRERCARILVVLTFCAFANGCVTIPYGSPPRQARLGQLTRGQSTPADVLLVLGEPRGAGAQRWWRTLESRTLWFYQYQVASSGNTENKILLVFFHHDRYDGYMWFSTNSLVTKE